MRFATSVLERWRTFRVHLSEHKGQVGLSVRVTVAAIMGFLLSQLLHVPLPLWTVLTAVVLTQVSFGSSVRATVNYLLGTLSGAVYAGALAALVPHTGDLATVAVMALAVAPLALLAAINPSFNAATFTGILVVLFPGLSHVGPVESAMYRVIEVALGGVTALAVSLVLPTRARSLALESAAQLLDLMATHLQELFSGFTQAYDVAAIAEIQRNIGQGFARSDTIAAEARHERLSFYAAEPTLGPLLRTLLRLRHDFVIIGRAGAVPLPETFKARLGPPLEEVTKTAAEYLRRNGEALARRQKSAPLKAVEAALDNFADVFAGARREGLTRDLSDDTVERIFALGFALEQLRDNFRDLERCVTVAARWR